MTGTYEWFVEEPSVLSDVEPGPCVLCVDGPDAACMTEVTCDGETDAPTVTGGNPVVVMFDIVSIESVSVYALSAAYALIKSNCLYAAVGCEVSTSFLSGCIDCDA